MAAWGVLLSPCLVKLCPIIYKLISSNHLQKHINFMFKCWCKVLICNLFMVRLFFPFTGLGLRPLTLDSDTIMLISYPGELFMRLLKLMILPLVIASLIAGKWPTFSLKSYVIWGTDCIKCYLLCSSLFSSVALVSLYYEFWCQTRSLGLGRSKHRQLRIFIFQFIQIS